MQGQVQVLVQVQMREGASGRSLFAGRGIFWVQVYMGGLVGEGDSGCGNWQEWRCRKGVLAEQEMRLDKEVHGGEEKGSGWELGREKGWGGGRVTGFSVGRGGCDKLLPPSGFWLDTGRENCDRKHCTM